MNQLSKLMYSVLQAQTVWTLDMIMLRQKKKEVPFYFHLGLSFQNNLTVTTSPPLQLQLLTIINKGQPVNLILAVTGIVLTPSLAKKQRPTALFKAPEIGSMNLFSTQNSLPILQETSTTKIQTNLEKLLGDERVQRTQTPRTNLQELLGSREPLAFTSPDLSLFCLQLSLTVANLQVNMVFLPDK